MIKMLRCLFGWHHWSEKGPFKYCTRYECHMHWLGHIRHP